ERLLDRAQALAQNGDRAQASELLAQLENLLENLRAAQPGQMPQGESQARQMMQGLQQLMQRQQRLLDRSFEAQRQQGQLGQMGQMGQTGEPSLGQQGAQAPPGGAGEAADEAGRQEGLRRQLGDIMRRLGEAFGDIPEPFGRAERAMHDATGALLRDLPGRAIAPQTEALDQLQQAARDYARQLQQRYGRQMGNGFGMLDRNTRDQQERDPFGRPLPGDGTYDESDVKIPSDNTLAKSRHILDELRRRAGERERPQLELDYINRLLERF
ncbi:MAG TPA: DUF4175 family protein, partial [Stellaceae bacterium]|nr:DUF4175 family protein [Stellaceae bacterium]